jgi:ribose transport system ATP-binding protein/inositol transport system ATP-binding protein
MEDLGYDINVDTKVESLSIAQQQIVEIVRALSIHHAKVIIMDEPTASIPERDANKLFETINSLSRKGIGIIYISHRMEEVMNIANRITVFRDGCYVATRNAKETNLQQIVEMMVGRQIDRMFQYKIKKTGKTILEMKSISNKLLTNVNFDLKEGEIHGLYGLIGSGRTELMHTLFGLDHYTGSIKFRDKEVKAKCSKDAMNLGIALVPEDRKSQGLFLSNTIKFNSMITILEWFMKNFKIDYKRENAVLSEYQEKLQIKYASVNQTASSLSGGNQQKIVLSKWLATNPDILILDEPTRGIDVGAKSEVYEFIFKLVDEGVSIILVSSELPEIINLCTRVSIMREGKMVKTLDRNNFSQEAIFEYAMQ